MQAGTCAMCWHAAGGEPWAYHGDRCKKCPVLKATGQDCLAAWHLATRTEFGDSDRGPLLRQLEAALLWALSERDNRPPGRACCPSMAEAAGKKGTGLRPGSPTFDIAGCCGEPCLGLNDLEFCPFCGALDPFGDGASVPIWGDGRGR